MVAHSEIIAILAAADSFNSLSFGRSRFPPTYSCKAVISNFSLEQFHNGLK
ncbi:hypothetical protein H6G00_06045 [Leptolyngbya sp. FACHB-541]|uniref:hypothetical protein n=1 Tax=Leptolyngbya sp. FACHB-541 TaxID=2692810 RepID=UPI0016849270|nr:hypothetical protein [Leptolyngbya sp. FACHB-541]MBD1996180.1 hypothetical protein [Leptolyngbya sp. FACHB-541]